MTTKSVDFGWSSASTLLTQVYRRFYRKNPKDLSAEITQLFDQIKDYGKYKALEVTGGDVEKAIKNYIYNDDINSDENGKFFPNLSDILAEVRYVISARKRREDKEVGDTKASFDDSRPSVEISLDGTAMQDFLPKLKSVHVIDTSNSKCPYCRDNGWVRFYYIPDRPHHVFSGEEWMKLHDRDQVKASMFKCSICYCENCELGRLMYRKFEQNEIRPPRMRDIERLVALRIKKKKEMDVEKSISEASQGDLLINTSSIVQGVSQ